MVVAFCGHADYFGGENDERHILKILETQSKGESLEIWLGEYGGFDRFAHCCAQKYKEKHPETRLIFVTPYISVGKDQQYRFDEILYPPIEHVPPKFAISYRNRWMVDNADFMIAYVVREFGGAYTMYRYAKRKKKEIFNIAL